jgi:hypothetical protein
MFEKYDDLFECAAGDPIGRLLAIRDLSRRRTITFWCALGTSACALGAGACALVGRLSGNSAVAAGLYFAAAMHWSMHFKFDSDLRLLRAIERLHVGRNDKPSN